jgi:hypothetical protein
MGGTKGNTCQKKNVLAQQKKVKRKHFGTVFSPLLPEAGGVGWGGKNNDSTARLNKCDESSLLLCAFFTFSI